MFGEFTYSEKSQPKMKTTLWILKTVYRIESYFSFYVEFEVPLRINLIYHIFFILFNHSFEVEWNLFDELRLNT